MLLKLIRKPKADSCIVGGRDEQAFIPICLFNNNYTVVVYTRYP